MEFCSSFAVINSAFDLAAKLPGCNDRALMEYKKDITDRGLTICCAAVKEVTGFPWKRRGGNNTEDVKMNITAALVAKLMQNNEEKESIEDWTVDSDTDYFSAVTVGLPSFNRTFLYDIVKNCGLSKQFCQVIFSFKPKVSGGLLVELLQHMKTETDVEDILLLADILESLSLEYNPYMSGKQTSATSKPPGKTYLNPIEKFAKCGKKMVVQEADFSHVINELLECLQNITHLLIVQQDRLILRVFLALLGLVKCLTSGKIKTRNIVESRDKCLQKCTRYFKLMKCSSQRDFEEAYFFLQTLQLDNLWSEENIQHEADKADITNLIKYCEHMKHFLPNVADVIFKQWKEQLADVALLSTSDGVLFGNEHEHKNACPPDVNMTLALFGNADDKLPELNSPELVTFSNRVSEVRIVLENMLQNSYQHNVQQLKVKTSASIVDLKWDSYQEHLMMLCSLPIGDLLSQLEDWLGFLKRNTAFIKSNELKAIIRQLETVSNELDKERDTLTNIILASYRRLNMCQMLDVLDYVRNHHNPEKLFRVEESNRFESRLVSVFNKLANITDTEKAVGEICSLAIQSPRRTLLKILHDAVDNPGQQPLLMKLLQNIPVLCFLEDEVGRSSVSTIMEKLFLDISHNEKKRNNYNRLLTRLLKGHSLLHGRSVIQPGTFLQATVLPHLQEDLNNGDVTLESILQLILTTIQSRENLSWISGDVLFPVILSLCNIIDDNRSFDPEHLGANVNIKILTVSILHRIEKTLLQHPSAKNSKLVKWLFNSMRTLHWTTALYVRKLISLMPGCVLSLPSSLESLLQEKRSHWVFNVQGVDPLIALFEFTMVSDDTLRIVLDEGDPKALDGIPNVNQQAVVILSEKLKHSTGDEWNRASEVIQYLVRNEAIAVNIRPAARDTIPCVNLTDARSTFGTAQIFWEVMVLMTRSSGEADLGYNMMAYKEYVGAVKALLERQEKQEDNVGQAFVLSQLFCQNCFLLSELRWECRETLLVLVLDILNSHSKICANMLKLRNRTILTEVIDQKTAIEKAIRLTPSSQQESLLKKIHR